MLALIDKWRERRWEKIVEYKEHYKVKYSPINHIELPYATVDIYFKSILDTNHLIDIMEQEIQCWVEKYPVPTILAPYDASKCEITIDELKKGNKILGYKDRDNNVIFEWGDYCELFKNENIKHVSDNELNSIYKGLKFETRDEIKQKSNQDIQNMINTGKTYDFLITVWLVITLGILYLGFESYLVGMIAFIYSILKTIMKYLSYKGYKTKKQIAIAEKERKMEHYYYYCERNLDAFAKLRSEIIKKSNEEEMRL